MRRVASEVVDLPHSEYETEPGDVGDADGVEVKESFVVMGSASVETGDIVLGGEGGLRLESVDAGLDLRIEGHRALLLFRWRSRWSTPAR